MPKDPAADRLVIRNLEFIGGMSEKQGWRPESSLPEIAFAGRSNVGKSSLLNVLVRRKSFARVSRTPGRTREINFFRVNNAFVLVDLPGYGYARISKEQKAEWKPLIEAYLRRTTQLRGIVLLLDIRREPSDDDRAMLDFLAELEVPTIVALTKTDKLSKLAARERVAEISGALSLESDQVIPFSAVSGEGRVELLEAITDLLEAETR
ncbi:MAG: YihA family ribosome biogenesis GTP-binding protein [Gemmatimonadetes bacterium]|nr:MAG: YihA family ribosome biogenesis GTP-binding protein [Gemmatimonadota bacterium]PYP53538.1 MAG: YihA family ribosome biogenesis GTP-binding protein [Gemmatimonadota bacterium]